MEVVTFFSRLASLLIQFALEPSSVFVGKSMEGFSRIPAVVTFETQIMAFAESRKTTFQDHGIIEIIMRRGKITNGTTTEITWEDQVINLPPIEDGYRVMNPQPIMIPDELTSLLILIAIAIKSGVKEHEILFNETEERYHVVTSNSTDLGTTWSNWRWIDLDQDKKELPWNGITMFVNSPGHGIVENGSLYASAYYYVPLGELGKSRPTDNNSITTTHVGLACVLKSRDEGQTWNIAGSIMANMEAGCGISMGESAITTYSLQSDESVLLLSSRQYGAGGKKLLSRSTDGGQTWEEAMGNSQLPNPKNTRGNKGGLVTVHHRGMEYVVASHSSHTWERQNLALWYSTDGGYIWSNATYVRQCDGKFLLTKEEPKEFQNQYCGYSDVNVVTFDNGIGEEQIAVLAVLYESKDKGAAIDLALIEMDQLLETAN